jgi:hypothetical protein
MPHTLKLAIMARTDCGCGKLSISQTCLKFPDDLNELPDASIERKLILDAFSSRRAHCLDEIRTEKKNSAGADPTAEIGEDHNPETHLIPLVLDPASGKRP